MASKTAFSSSVADSCHIEKHSDFRPILAFIGTRRRTRHQSLRMESGRCAVAICQPSLVDTADHLAHHAAQKHYQEPYNPEDTTDYLEHSIHNELGELIKYDECYHTTSISFLKVKQNPRDRQGSSLLSPAPIVHPRLTFFSLRCPNSLLFQCNKTAMA